jgi:Flp pilus assembly protein TadG
MLSDLLCDGTTHDPAAATAKRPSRRHSTRRGISAMWMIVTLPVLLTLSCLVIDVANIWLARVELENSLEASALASVKEWAETGSTGAGWTDTARKVGVAYACHNAVRGQPVQIATNLGTYSGTNPNENAQCCLEVAPPEGNLVFGALTGDPITHPVTFDAALEPGCGGEGLVLFDVTGQGSAGLEKDNAWGIAFIRTDDTPNDLRIVRITIDLRAGGGSGTFTTTPALSSNIPMNWMVRDGLGGNSQADIVGFDATPSNQIQFTLLNSNSKLQIDFSAYGGDDGFAPCDRFRFGVRVADVSSGTSQDDGDGIGADAVGITVVYQQGANPPFTRTGRYYNTTEKDCRDVASHYTTCNNPPGDLIVSVATAPQLPSGIPSLPCPAASSATNNGQSWTLLHSGGGRPYAVRAQARINVPSLFQSILGESIGTYCVTVKTTAIYDCETSRPRLIKLDEYICTPP